jgi:hypothetical protein
MFFYFCGMHPVAILVTLFQSIDSNKVARLSVAIAGIFGKCDKVWS